MEFETYNDILKTLKGRSKPKTLEELLATVRHHEEVLKNRQRMVDLASENLEIARQDFEDAKRALRERLEEV